MPLDYTPLFNTIYAEAGGGIPEEIKNVASVFLNRAEKTNLEKALSGSSAYRKRSKEYLKAESGRMNPYEKTIYDRNKAIIQLLIDNPQMRTPYTYFENVKAFGNPPWAKKMKSYKDIGRQRFYIE